jgi:hypothetical protein
VLVPADEDETDGGSATEANSSTSTEGTTAGSSGTTADTVDTTGSGSSTGVDETTGNSATSGATDTAQSANDRCEEMCDALVGAACDNSPTMAGCMLTCEVLTSSAACDPTTHAYADCIAEGGVTCNGLGDPVSTGCAVAWLEAIGCAVTENPNPDIVEPCSDYCDALAEPACPNANPVDACNTNCLWLGATGTGCDDEWGAFLQCANEATISCFVGFPIAEGCGPEFAAYGECIDAAGG